MAYKTIKHTKVSYNASGFISYQEIEMEKMYYMPDVIDEPNNYWTINCLNKLTGEVVLMLNECPIRTGYRILITELNNNDVSTYHIHILNTNFIYKIKILVIKNGYLCIILFCEKTRFYKPVRLFVCVKNIKNS